MLLRGAERTVLAHKKFRRQNRDNCGACLATRTTEDHLPAGEEGQEWWRLPLVFLLAAPDSPRPPRSYYRQSEREFRPHKRTTRDVPRLQRTVAIYYRWQDEERCIDGESPFSVQPADRRTICPQLRLRSTQPSENADCFPKESKDGWDHAGQVDTED